MSQLIVTLADGFEEIEAITSIDVLRRAGVDVTVVGLDGLEIKGSNGIIIKADRLISEVKIKEVTGLILPGGMPGAKNLKNNNQVIELVKDLMKQKSLIAAICAAPIVLAEAGVIKNKDLTSFPGFETELNGANYLSQRVVRDENLITARGPGVALEFALEIIDYLQGEKKTKELKENMLTNF